MMSRMFRLLTAALAVCVLAVLAVPATASAANAYCSPTGDFCVSAAKRNGIRYLSLRTFAHRGRVQVCVTHDGQQRDCRRFRLRLMSAGIYAFERRWSKHFPNHGPGRYRVTFRQPAFQIGPTIGFRLGS